MRIDDHSHDASNKSKEIVSGRRKQTIALSATLAVTCAVLPLTTSTFSSPAERIRAIHKAVESGDIELVDVFSGMPAKVELMDFNQGESPKDGKGGKRGL